MANSRPIVILEDDEDDQELIEEAIRDIGFKNKIIFFKDGEEGVEYLRMAKEQPFIIISDLKMPRMDGLEFKICIDQDQILRQKMIPFVFLTTSTDITVFKRVNSQTTILGYFVKPNNYHDLKYTIKTILDYWGAQESFSHSFENQR